MSHAEEQAF